MLSVQGPKVISAEMLVRFSLVILNNPAQTPSWSDPAIIAALVSYTAGGGQLLFLDCGTGLTRRHEYNLLQGGRIICRYPWTVADFQPAPGDHPVTAGMASFTLEEAQAEVLLDPFVQIKVILECPYGQSRLPFFWVRRYLGGRVMTLTASRPELSLCQGMMPRLLRRTAFWASDRI